MTPAASNPPSGSTPEALCAEARARTGCAVLLDGRGGFGTDWGGPLAALEPRLVAVHRRRDAPGVDPLALLARISRERDRGEASPHTGLVALLSYDALDPAPVPTRDDDGLPELIVLAVDRAARFDETGEASVVAANPTEAPPTSATFPRHEPATVERPTTSLPRERYLAAVERVRRHIEAGDIYQGNLCQRFTAAFAGDPLELYTRLVAGTPAPRSAFVQAGDFALVSASPEVFLDVDADGVVETRPIKGTRPRGRDAAEDRRHAADLAASAKDRAELTMIVDLERNDLGRVCETGSVRVIERAGLESYPAVHHLVARVAGRLRSGVGPEHLLGATFPGGSITGAPKRRAMEILREIEPVRRNFFTGSLLWLADDGTMASSILIRTIVVRGTRAFAGAGGGIVWDSVPAAEWAESNHKARALTQALGFDPENAEDQEEAR